MTSEVEEHHGPDEPIVGVFTDLFSAEIVPPTWVIEDLLPVGLVFVGAPPKSGKSTLTMAMSALVAGFECKALPPFLSKVPRSGRAQVYSYEATAGELRHMMEFGLRVKGQANESIIIADDPWLFRLDDNDGLAKMQDWLNEREPRLCILDPLRDFHALEEKDSGAMNRMLRPLRQWAMEHESCILIVHHTRKLDDDKQGYSANDLRGTSALFGIADGVLMLSPKEGSPFIQIKATFKRARGWERSIRISAYDYTGPATEHLSTEDTAVKRAIDAGCEDIEEIEQQIHIPTDRVKKALEKLDRNGIIKRQGLWWVSAEPPRTKDNGNRERRGALVHVPRTERGAAAEVPGNPQRREGAGKGNRGRDTGVRRPAHGAAKAPRGSDDGKRSNRAQRTVKP